MAALDFWDRPTHLWYSLQWNITHCSSTDSSRWNWRHSCRHSPIPFPIITFFPRSWDLFPLLVSPVLPPKVRDCLLEGPRYTHDLMFFSSELPVPVNFLLSKSHNLLHPVTRQFFSSKAKVIITHKLNYWEHFLCIGAWQTKSDFNAPSPALPLYCFETQEYELLPTNKQAQPNWRKNAERAPFCKEIFCEVFNNTRNVVLVRVPETTWNFCYLFT